MEFVIFGVGLFKFTDVRVLILLLANHQDAYFTETKCQNVPLR